jgi:hypothetical protein
VKRPEENVIDETSGIATASRPVLFARHARAALEKHVPEARTAAAHWHLGTNEAWVRFPRIDGLYGYFALRRHLDWVSGEAGLSREPNSLAELFRLPGHPRAAVAGYRIRLGDLIDGKDRWWPSGDTESQLAERLGHLALQLAVKGKTFFRRWPGGGR